MTDAQKIIAIKALDDAKRAVQLVIDMHGDDRNYRAIAKLQPIIDDIYSAEWMFHGCYA